MKGSALTDVGNATDPQDTVRITRWDAAIDALRPFLFMSPYLLVFFLFLFLPALSGFVISFTDWEILGTPNWVGLENFEYIAGERDVLAGGLQYAGIHPANCNPDGCRRFAFCRFV